MASKSFQNVNTDLFVSEEQINRNKLNELNTEVIIKNEIFDVSESDSIDYKEPFKGGHEGIKEEGILEETEIKMENERIKLEQQLNTELIIKDEIFDGNDLEFHSTENEETSLTCEVCDKTFNKKHHLTSHKRTHTDKKRFSCELCDKSFNYKIDLIRHERIHTGEKPFSCDICDKTFTLNSNLTTHKRIHTGEKPFSCELCDKSFNIKTDLIRHERIHTGEKPFSCEICDKTFTWKSNLIRHKRTHNEDKSKL
ncbi:gastrula zinc finger protein XlCGF71.1-like isoform X3 [Chrysoperla carnea]|uniref:gastrula zinc finger protein XlCGF71.1-like isoform X3 n=1 Tax=Chrysoperla carnea TaxID=189513 RepID=UPI001D09899A|nr:gastrula zinc finger protein XlCGF71.1-like isoform X3 [Chrysoperla carnea]